MNREASQTRLDFVKFAKRLLSVPKQEVIDLEKRAQKAKLPRKTKP